MLIIRKVSQQRRMELVFFPLETYMKKNIVVYMLLIEENKFLTSVSLPLALSVCGPGSCCWWFVVLFFFYPSSYNTAATIVLILLLSHWDQTRSPPLLCLKPLQEDCQVPPVISRCSVVTFLVNHGRQTLFYHERPWSGKREDWVFHALNSHDVFFLTHHRCKNTNDK